MKTTRKSPLEWGLEVGRSGALYIGGCNTVQLAAQYGTPLHVVDEQQLTARAEKFLAAFAAVYPGAVSVHYAFKCNAIPGVVRLIRQAGLKAEVMSAFELFLALQLGFRGREIVVNGPFKPDRFLIACVEAGVRYVIADSIDELISLNRIAGQLHREVGVLLRINPDFTPNGMNSGTATGNREGCAFGLDLKGGEVARAFEQLSGMKNLRFHGFHFHIGTGIRHPSDYYRALLLLKAVVSDTQYRGFEVKVLDVGGGFAAPQTREMTTWEMLRYQATNRLPDVSVDAGEYRFEAFARAVTRGIAEIFGGDRWPELITEPGRSIAGPGQILLLGVHQVKDRVGVHQWLTTDGGIGTVTMPTFYEFHEVFLCNDVHRPLHGRVTINGPGCFAADVVYRNKRMPQVQAGEVLAIMDSGAYFTSWESNFGHPRPAVVAVANGSHRILRHRESFEQMMARDVFEP